MTTPTKLPKQISIDLAECTRCGYQWYPRWGIEPAHCANRRCNSPYWNRPRRTRKEAVSNHKSSRG